MNAETAVELVVRSFMALEHVSWVPDPGYNWVSFYANEKRGMSIEKQKTFLKFFVAAARERLLKPNLKHISPALLENFKISAQYDRSVEPDLSVIEPYSGVKYAAAEKFWINEFQHASRPGLAPKAASGASTSVARVVNQQLSERLSALYELEFAELAFASFGLLLSRISGQDEAVVIASLDDKEPFPVLFRHNSESSFVEFVRASRERLEQSRQHRLFALFILTNPLRMKEYGSTCPVFHAGCLVAESPETPMSARLEHYPAVNKQVDLLLKLIKGASGTTLEISCPTGRHSQEQVEKIAEGLISTLDAISARLDLKIKDFIWDYEPAEKKAAAAASQQLVDVSVAAQ
jgi:hypothetical protein